MASSSDRPFNAHVVTYALARGSPAHQWSEIGMLATVSHIYIWGPSYTELRQGCAEHVLEIAKNMIISLTTHVLTIYGSQLN